MQHRTQLPAHGHPPSVHTDRARVLVHTVSLTNTYESMAPQDANLAIFAQILNIGSMDCCERRAFESNVGGPVHFKHFCNHKTGGNC
jgi:hypothetical protein